jgi:predicted nucleic acid-binding protein
MELGAPIRAVILDASYVVEALEGDPCYRESWAAMAESGAMQLVPAHFWAEVANALLRGVGMSAAEVMRRLERLAASGIEVADRGLRGLTEAVELAHRHRLSVYDALYLQLALDTDATLASLDTDLVRAAKREGLAVVA